MKNSILINAIRYKSLRNQDEVVREKIFTNLSKRASQMLKEDMECIGPIGTINVREAQEKIMNVICHMESTGEIIIPQHKGEIVK
jgi:flagellar motor switch protein FliG